MGIRVSAMAAIVQKHDMAFGYRNESIKGLIHTRPAPKLSAMQVSATRTTISLHSDLKYVTGKRQQARLNRDGVFNQITEVSLAWASDLLGDLPFKWTSAQSGRPWKFLLRITGDQATSCLAFSAALLPRWNQPWRYLKLKGGGGTGRVYLQQV